MPRKDKCFSTCRKRPKPECESPNCYYTNGNQYKYCRLAFTRKMGKDCIPVLRNPHHLNKTTKDHSTKEKIDEFRKKYAKKIATRKIGRFLRKTDPRVRSKFLQSVCSDAGVCIAFGTHADAIRKHFSDFEDFTLLSKPLKQIGAVSVNGFVKELTYEHRGYVANAILKSSASQRSDNLLYEALVGFFLNKHSKHFPCFLETYGLYEYYEPAVYDSLLKNKTNSPELLNLGLSLISTKRSEIEKDDIRASCEKPTTMAVLIQHLKEAVTLHEKLKTESFLRNDLGYILFHVYMALYSLEGSFTHYDLHTENVLVYEPVKGKYIEYHYHLDNGDEFVFKSPYIAKIIDYGRCYFNDNGKDSKAFRKEMCKICVNPLCGARRGYSWLNAESDAEHFFISSKTYNPSHDLRLLKAVGVKTGMDGHLKDIIRKTVYGVGLKKEDAIYGTEPHPTSGLPLKIKNVKDAYEMLRRYIAKPSIVKLNKAIYADDSKRLGQLHIYHDHRPMRYVPSSE